MKSTAEILADEYALRSESAEPNHSEVLKQLDKITESSHFKNSKRYPALLRFVVEHTLAGRIDALKERTLGIEVFARPNDYDTNADPVVRVTAGEIRKRIAQYYRGKGHEHELRIELPVGSYVPRFFPASIPYAELEADPPQREGATSSQGLRDGLPEPIISPPSEEQPALSAAGSAAVHSFSKPGLWFLVPLVVLLVAVVAGATAYGIHLWGGRNPERGIESFWRPILSGDAPALIVIGVHSLNASGKDLSPETHASLNGKGEENMLSSMIRYDMVPVSDIVSYSELTKLLTERGHSYRTQGASETTFGQLQRGPVVLVGGFDNFWTLRLTSTLRYRFNNPGALVGVIVDSERPTADWKFDNGQDALSNSRDYAIVARFFDPRIQQQVVIAAGIGKSGTAAATEFLTSDRYLKAWLQQAKPAKGKNFEIVLSTEIVEGQQGPPQVVATSVW